MENSSDLKTRTKISTTVENELLEKFKDLSKNTGIPQSKLIDRAIQLLLREMNEIEQSAFFKTR